MNAINRTRALGVFVGLALIVSACGGGGATVANEEKSSQSFTVGSDVTVTVTTYNGAIEVRAGSDGRVEVEVIKRGGGATDAEAKADLENIELAMEQSAGQVKLAATHLGSIPSDSGVSFKVTVPAEITLVASLENGPISVEGVKGDITATANNGDLTVRGAGDGVLTLKTTNGNLTVEGASIAGLTASSTNGAATFQGSLAESDEANTIDVGNGSATLTLPGDAQFGIDAQTSNGQLASDFDVQGDQTSTSIKGTVGSSPVFGLVVRVKNGPITIKRQ
jgi:DUF4097 and DUF4098 domain-containing protein YvlB